MTYDAVTKGIMSRLVLPLTLAAAILWSCGIPANAVPDWEKYRAHSANQSKGSPPNLSSNGIEKSGSEDNFTFADLKSESDQSLAFRLLGANGRRIAFIDRHRNRWQYYGADSEAPESIDLYTHPESQGSAFGVCGVEKYSFSFDDQGRIESVSLQKLFGVEGPIFQKSGFNWDAYENSCKQAAPDHATSYFPAEDGLAAQDMVRLLVTAIDRAAGSEKLSYKFECLTFDGKDCSPDIRGYLGRIRPSDIDETTRMNCRYAEKQGDDCYTVRVGEHRLGAFPKEITVHGSTYKNEVTVYSVSIREGFTVS